MLLTVGLVVKAPLNRCPSRPLGYLVYWTGMMTVPAGVGVASGFHVEEGQSLPDQFKYDAD